MILNIEFYNPITCRNDVLVLKYPNITYNNWRNNSYYSDNDIKAILENILCNLDCSREFSFGRPMTMANLNYNEYLSNFYYYIVKFNNKALYDVYIDKLIELHVDNIIFENEYANRRILQNKSKTPKKRKPNRFIKYTTKDLFTNETCYIYENPYTKETIESSDPNLLEELNSRKHKKKTKVVEPKGMMFKFS